MTNPSWTLQFCPWSTHQEPLLDVRIRVFVNEQNVPIEEEVDDWDEPSLHLLATDLDGKPIGCGRMVPNRTVGRFAVDKEWRGKGLGSALLNTLLQRAKEEGWPEVRLSAQVQAIPFYQSLGFEPFGDVFMDAGIPHRSMLLTF